MNVSIWQKVSSLHSICISAQDLLWGCRTINKSAGRPGEPLVLEGAPFELQAYRLVPGLKPAFSKALPPCGGPGSGQAADREHSSGEAPGLVS